jgi:hypothetical protein
MKQCRAIATALMCGLAACGGGGGTGGGGGQPPPVPTPTPSPLQFYQPLATGDTWKYSCHFRNPPMAGTFPIANRVTGTQMVNGVQTFAFALQVVTSPTQIATQTMLLANDTQGNVTLYGYLASGTVLPVTPTLIVAAAPSTSTPYNYPALGGGTVTRSFAAFTVTNPTPLGTFNVAVYYESGATHNYGYALGKGIMEEDHGPNFRYDCLIGAFHLNDAP